MANARPTLLLALAFGLLPRASAADDEPIVTNVVNGLVYVSVGTRDGAAVGDQVTVLRDDGATVGTIEFDLCGEVICRAKLPPALAGKIVRGMRVQVRADTGPAVVAPPPSSPKAAPSPKPASPKAPGEPPPKAAGEPSSEGAGSPLTTEGPAPIAPDTTVAEPAPEPAPEPPPVKKKKKAAAAPAPSVPPPQLNPPTLADVLGGPPPAAPESRSFEGGPVPPGYRVERRPNDGLVRWGWIGLGVSYGIGAIVGLGARNGGGWMALPVLGPWVHLAARESDPDPYSSSNDGSTGVVMIGLGQGISALLLGIGYAGTKTLVRSGSPVAMTVTPVVTRTTYGFGVAATF